ncbi:hypothetical protein C8R46DRAFT_1034885 [Mycena filopes]|nr:hypothetical protein C8R46DRAFT_1034885 [Mycena filopes]
MHPVTHIDDPDPLITLRVEWQLFSARPVPIIPARMSRDEILHLIGEEVEVPQRGLDDTASPAGRDTPEPDSPRRDPRDDITTVPGGNTAAPAGGNAGPIPFCSNNQILSTRADAKYRKPTGQPNRPSCGGYSLEPHLVNKCGWEKSQFQAVQLAAQKLDLTCSYRKQNAFVIQHICDQVKREHNVSRGYDKSWPITDMLMMHLKNTSEAERKRRGPRVKGPELYE